MLKYILYVGVGFFISEGVFYFIRRLLYYLKKEGSEDDVSEVIWTNELTQQCVEHHFSYKKGYSLTPTNDQSGTMSSCYNPFCANTNIGRVIWYLDNAKYSIDLGMYTFTSMEMSNALQRALRRNVIVRIITDNTMSSSTGSQVNTLTRLGAPVRFPLSTSLMHHKFCIIDGVNRVSRIMLNDQKEYNAKKVKSILLNGSLNWTAHGFNGNWENILITSNKLLVQKFEEEFERMWIAFDRVDIT